MCQPGATRLRAEPIVVVPVLAAMLGLIGYARVGKLPLLSVAAIVLVGGMLRFPPVELSADAKSRLRLDVAAVLTGTMTVGLWLVDPHDGPVAVGWLLELATTMLAVYLAVRFVLAGRSPAARSIGVALPYVAMVTGWGVCGVILARGELDSHAVLVGTGSALTTGLVVGRQITAFKHIAELLRERDRLAAQLTELAFHDVLTGLPNRALFMQRLEAGLADGPVTVFLIDLNDFKPVNDQFGHATGDELLIEVGRRLRSCVREDDTVARLGGDEFAVLVKGLGKERHDELAAALQGRVTLGAAEVPLSASIGAAHGQDDPDTLLHAADMAMYDDKRRAHAVPDPA
jgi:diguanylate cyclase (GGDEF)-like protein